MNVIGVAESDGRIIGTDGSVVKKVKIGGQSFSFHLRYGWRSSP
jgi:hypothetical protein